MKQRVLLGAMLILASQAACSAQYRIEMDPAVFMATWNRDMHGPDMTLTRQQQDGDAHLVSEHWLVVSQVSRDHRWTLEAPDAVGPETCTELLVAALGVSRGAAQSLIDRGQKETRFRDGDLDFTLAHEGGWICSVAVNAGR